MGKNKFPVYRLVISEKARDTQADNLEILGTYNPHSKELNVKEDRIKHWVGHGAQMSDTVNNLLLAKGIISEGKKKKSVTITKKRQGKIDKAKEEKAAKEKEAAEAKAAAEAEAKAAAESVAAETEASTQGGEEKVEEVKEEEGAK